jgi:cytochrome c-type biogenesis protein CcmE
MLKLNKQQSQRLYYLVILMLGIALAASLILYSLKQNINLFFTPSQALKTKLSSEHTFRLGGQVKPGSLRREKDKLTVHFILTDLKQDIPITYTGILPDLFREGNGAIAEGHWTTDDPDKRTFIATQILAKHDENYMPKAVYEALRKEP